MAIMRYMRESMDQQQAPCRGMQCKHKFKALIANSVLVCVTLVHFYIGTVQLKKVLGWA